MTISREGSPLLSMAEFAELAQVKRPVVSTWRRRYSDFPASVGRDGSRPLFRGADVVRWLTDRELGNASADRLRQELALHSITAFAAEYGPRPLIEITGSLLCLRHLAGRQLPPNWAELLRLAGRLDAEDEFVLGELRAAAPSALALAHLAEDLTEAAYSPGRAYEWLLAARTRIGLTDLTVALPVTELLNLVTDLADLPSRLARTSPVTVAELNAGAGDLLSALIMRTDQPAEVKALAAEPDGWLARLTRRRLLLAGVEDYALDVQTGTDVLEAMGDADLIVTQLPYRPGEARSALTALEELERVSDLLGPGRTAVVVGPADALIDRLRAIEEARFRSALIRSGIVEAAIALPGGVIPHRPGYRAALWVMTRDPIEAARGRVLVCDISAEALTQRVRAQLAEDILLWRAEGHRADGHDPRYGLAVPIATIDADFGGPLTPPGPPLSQVFSRTVIERPAVISEAEGRLEHTIERSLQHLDTCGHFRGHVMHRVGPQPPRTTIAALVASGRVTKVKGHRINAAHARREGHHPLMGPEEITGACPLGSRQIDRLVLVASYDHVALTEPGDIVYTTTPRFALTIDHNGFSVPLFPARVLRVTRDVKRPFTPRVLAALLSAARNTTRSPGAVHAPRIDDLTIPDLDPSDVERLEAFLAEIEVRQRLLRAQQDELAEIHRLTVAGFADGTLAINNHH
ncbi:hypothetical protein [Nonomuraea typhae]|uniref:hypothetical protein n=1 Tax=Nonomuraea typhae TaxID=2603600 RepID=UPI0012F9F8FB|nr:hypothetical protein [Nonomuraea typhae]